MNDRPIMFRASSEMFQQLEALAVSQERSIAWVTRRLVEEGLKGSLPSPSNGSPPRPYMLNNIPPLSLTPSPIPPKNNSIKIRVDEPFEGFWSAYPRRIGKAAARRAWEKAMKVTTPEVIGAALRAAEWPEDPQYIPHPATWLNQGRWDDQPAPVILKERPEDELARLWGEVKE
jgi:hypothetical protein